MRTLQQVIASLSPAKRAKVLARGRELILREERKQMKIAREVMKRRRNALRELAKR